jgi:hypothetical protein
MKWCAFVIASLSLLAQKSVETVYDGLGRPMPSPSFTETKVGNTTTRTEQRPSANGRMVPWETVEERVVVDDGRTRIVERTIKHYDFNGLPAPPEKVRVEEQKAADGSSTTRTSTWRGDLNGNLSLYERSVAETRKSDSVQTTNETVERRSINGSFDVAEKRSTTVSTTPTESLTNMMVYKRNENGGFYEALKQVSESRTTASGKVENVATYDGATGTLRLIDQTVRKTVTAADGSAQTVEDVYKTNAPGIQTPSGETQPRLAEQRVIARQVSGGNVTETVDVRRASVSEPNRLTDPVRVSESVCKGCK